MNLLMIAPLFDSRGKLRYFIGAQVDVSGLVKECTGLDALQTLLARQEAIANGEEPEEKEKKDEFQELSEMLNTSELDTVRKFGGRMHKEQVEETDEGYGMHQRRLLLKEPSPDLGKSAGGFNLSRFNGKLEGIYQNVSAVRIPTIYFLKLKQKHSIFSSAHIPHFGFCSPLPLSVYQACCNPHSSRASVAPLA